MSQMLFDPMIGRLTQVLDLREQQHALTATNLANADTPGFKARVVDFENLLSDVMSGRLDGNNLNTSGAIEVQELEPAPYAVDGNSVMPEREVARMKANSTMYSAVARGLSKHLALLKYAAGDGR